MTKCCQIGKSFQTKLQYFFLLFGKLFRNVKKKVIYALPYNGNSNSTVPKFYVALKVTVFPRIELKEYKEVVECSLEVSDIPQ